MLEEVIPLHATSKNWLPKKRLAKNSGRSRPRNLRSRYVHENRLEGRKSRLINDMRLRNDVDEFCEGCDTRKVARI